jgi:hypothetical protein
MQKRWLLLVVSLLTLSVLKSQNNNPPAPLRIAVFTQLYLDSAFTSERVYKHDVLMPKYILPGLDFMEGLLIAADSLRNAGNVEIRIYDTKSDQQKITTLEKNNLFDSIHLIIGAVSGNEYKLLSDIALAHQIPFLSATFPNEGGVKNNPFTIILNPTIGVHCNAIVQFIQQYFFASRLIFLQKKTSQDNRLRTMFIQANQNSGLKKSLKWIEHNASDTFKIDDIIPLLDSTRQNLIICASFDEKLATQCLNYKSDLKPYEIQFIGLPHWETLREVNLTKHNNKTIYFPTAFFNDGSSDFEIFQRIFQEKTLGKASDIAFKGYDAAVNFIQLLIKHQQNFINQINDAQFQKMIHYNIQPVLSAQTKQPDYFENKRIYIIKKTNGLSTKMGKF